MVVVLLMASVAGFSCAGEQGPQGPQGIQGPAGPEGEQGLAGKDGADGLSAYQIWLDEGNTGTEADFLANLQGPAGPEGPAGPTGPEGPQGPEGPAGPAGPQGEQGPAGPQGEQGSQGLQGPQGPQGPEGPPGPNMVVAMGTITWTGPTIVQGYNVSSVTWSSTYQRHEIGLTGIYYDYNDYVTVVTPLWAGDRYCTYTSTGAGKLNIYCWDSAGNKVQNCSFSFIVLEVS